MADMIPMGKLLEAAQKEYPNLDKEELTALIGLQIEARQQQLKNEMKKIKMDKGGLSKEKNKDIEKASMPKSKPDVINKDIMDMVDFRNYEKEKGELHPEDPRAGDNMDTGKAFYEEGDKTLAGEIARLTKLAKERKKFLGKEVNAAKGGSMPNQMEMFEDGGLKDEGNTIDPVSGNDVPPGSTQEEVRDDIPAQLSEGEFVFPADVVRYIGLEKLMMLRQEAKQGLKTMEDMGQMGNSEEATMPDDLPFDMTDLDIDDEEEYNSEDMEMAQGGVVYAANGFAGTTTATNQLGSKASSFGNTATRVQPKTYTPPPIPTAPPVGGFKYGADQADKQGKLQFGNLFKDAGGADEYRTYVNDAGAEIQVPFKNGKVMTGFTIPEGYKLKTEKVDTAKTQSTAVKSTRPTQQDDGGGDAPSLTEQGFREGSNVTFMGGTNVNGKRVGSRDIGVILDIPGGIAKLGGIAGAKMAGITGKYPDGTMMGITIKGDPNKIKYVTPVEYKKLMKDPKAGDEFLNTFAKERSIEDDVKSISQERRIDDKLTKDEDFMKGIADVPKGISRDGFDSFKATAPTVPSDIGTVANTQQVDSGSSDPSGGFSDSYDSPSGDTSVSESGYGSSGGPGDFNIGGLAGKKKKIKPKKMKRGGLASR